MAMRIALCLILLASVCSAQVSRRVQGDGLIFQLTFENGGGVNDAGPINGSTRREVDYGTTNALQFDSAGTNGVRAFTVSVWVRPASTNTFQSVAARIIAGGAFQGVDIRTAGDDYRPQILLGGGNNSNRFRAWRLAASLVIGQWQHLVFTVDSVSEQVRIYVNGVEQSTTTTTGSAGFAFADDFTTSTAPFLIGARAANTSGGRTLLLNGTLDDFRFYGRALSPQEIAALANSRRRNHSQ